MGVFSRLRDIINSNLNSMLEKAEDPEKLIKMMIMEMEDTLVEIKASAAGVMASRKKTQRAIQKCQTKADDWESKASLALAKNREDLAREAIREKQAYLKQAEGLQNELVELDGLITQYTEDIRQLEDKLTEAREKHRVLVQRHIHAQGKKRAQNQIRKAESNGAFVRFEQLENRIDRMEAEADLVNIHRGPSLEQKFQALQDEEEVEKELQQLKARAAQKTPSQDGAK